MRHILKLLLFFLILSCSTKKDVLLIQDSANFSEYKLNFKVITIQPDDILRIKVSSKSPELTSLYSYQQNTSISSNTIQGYQIEGYLVNSDGFVNIPALGPIFIKGLTLSEASEAIKMRLFEQEDLKNVTVDVRIVNTYFTIIGEINSPGRYSFLENNMNIFQALGIAGDLTINGKRSDVRILRKNNGVLKVNSLDLTSSELLNSENFQVFPGDVIIVNPNSSRVKNAGIIGNSGNLLSVLSFILSSLILITSQ